MKGFLTGFKNHWPLIILLVVSFWMLAKMLDTQFVQASTATTPTATPTATLIASGLPQPILDDIVNEDGNGSFMVAWSAVTGAGTYKLKQSFNNNTWHTVYEGPLLSINRANLPNGQYCYRVRAFNQVAFSDWSAIKCTIVGGGPPVPTATPTPTATQEAPTATPTEEPAGTPTKTPLPASTSTATPTATGTNAPSPTPTATATSYPLPTPVAIANLPVIVYQRTPDMTPTSTPAALYSGLTARWDGRGFVRTDEYYEPGTHRTMVFTEMVDSDIIEAENDHWYDPNPLDWQRQTWQSYYSVSSGELVSASWPGDPAFQWDYYRILPYHYNFQDGQIVEIDGQEFRATGPRWGYGAFGQQITYWRLVNQETFLSWDEGGDWQLYVHPGDVTLEYDVNTRLLLKSDILRHYYNHGELTQYIVQYIAYLTDSNAYPDQQKWRPPASSEYSLTYQRPADSLAIPERSFRPAP